MIGRGSIVCDRADRRHVGLVEAVCWRDMHRGLGRARVRWLGSGWLSTVPVADLRPAVAPPEPARGRFEFPTKRI